MSMENPENLSEKEIELLMQYEFVVPSRIQEDYKVNNVKEFVDKRFTNQSEKDRQIATYFKILNLYNEYPDAISVISSSLLAFEKKKFIVPILMELYLRDESFEIIRAFEDNLSGYEATQISRIQELAGYYGERAIELLPKYKEVILQYIDAPLAANHIGRKVCYAGSPERAEKILAIFSSPSVRNEIEHYYKEVHSFCIGIRNIIKNQLDFSDFQNLVQETRIQIMQRLSEAVSDDDLSKIRDQIHWTDIDFSHDDYYNPLPRKLKSLNKNFSSKDAEMNSIIKTLVKELNTEFIKKVFDIDDVGPTGEGKMRNDILEHYKRKNIEIEKIDFDWENNRINIYLIKNAEKRSWSIPRIWMLSTRKIDQRGIIGLVKDIIENQENSSETRNF